MTDKEKLPEADSLASLEEHMSYSLGSRYGRLGVFHHMTSMPSDQFF